MGMLKQLNFGEIGMFLAGISPLQFYHSGDIMRE